MKNKILLTVSVLALMGAGPVLAQDNAAHPNTPPQGSGDLETDAKKAWEDIKEDTSQAYENVKAVFTDENETTANIKINTKMTASGMIGQPIYNTNNERVGTVEDIILDSSGNASMIVVADGEFPGIDMKEVAFNYDSIIRQNADGDVIMPLTEEMIDQAAAFSYDREKAGNDVRVIPANGYSVAKLLDADLVNAKKETVAEVDNISLRNGRAADLIIVFDQVLGVGGKKAALDYQEAKLVRDGDELDFQLTADQSAQFESYKKTATN